MENIVKVIEGRQEVTPTTEVHLKMDYSGNNGESHRYELDASSAIIFTAKDGNPDKVLAVGSWHPSDLAAALISIRESAPDLVDSAMMLFSMHVLAHDPDMPE